KQLLDLVTCTECGRCQDQCPAWNTGKPLSPKLVITDLRDHLFEKAPFLLGEADPEHPDGHDPAVLGKDLVTDVVGSDVLWSCTTCGACVEQCPVDIEHVDTILELRRYQVLMESRFPGEAGTMLRNVENSGDPWGLGAGQRLAWTEGLDFEVAVGGDRIPDDVEYLYWVGCAAALEDRARGTARAIARLLHRAGVRFARLGPPRPRPRDPPPPPTASTPWPASPRTWAATTRSSTTPSCCSAWSTRAAWFPKARSRPPSPTTTPAPWAATT